MIAPRRYFDLLTEMQAARALSGLHLRNEGYAISWAGQGVMILVMIHAMTAALVMEVVVSPLSLGNAVLYLVRAILVLPFIGGIIVLAFSGNRAREALQRMRLYTEDQRRSMALAHSRVTWLSVLALLFAALARVALLLRAYAA